MTCGPTKSSPSSHLPTILPGALNRHRHQGPSAEALRRVFEGASGELGLTVASMGAPCHRALQGSTTCPSEPLDSVQPACTTAWSLSERPHVRCRATGVLGKIVGGDDVNFDMWKQITFDLPNSQGSIVRSGFMSRCRGLGRRRRLRGHRSLQGYD
jgi:hypothetical protein